MSNFKCAVVFGYESLGEPVLSQIWMVFQLNHVLLNCENWLSTLNRTKSIIILGMFICTKLTCILVIMYIPFFMKIILNYCKFLLQNLPSKNILHIKPRVFIYSFTREVMMVAQEEGRVLLRYCGVLDASSSGRSWQTM